MTSRSPSRSEGEIPSSDSEANSKANTLSRSNKDRHVDRRTRTYLTPYTPPAKRRRSRSRSRSPFRIPREEKRTREHDRQRHDPRTFHVKYEDPQPFYRRNGSNTRRDSKRVRASSRNRSRSPYRHSRRSSRDEGYRPHGDRDLDEGRSTQGRDYETKPSDRKEPNTIAEIIENAATESSQTNHSDQTPVSEAEVNATTSMNDDAALIEERRRRRELIRNKYRKQATPLLVQALHLGTDPNHRIDSSESMLSSPSHSSVNAIADNSEAASTRAASPAAESPQDLDSTAPGSPNDFASPQNDDSALQGTGSPLANEASAADYDPTIDMQDERARHDKRLFKEDDVSLGVAGEQIPHHASHTEQHDVSKSNPEFDMFAEGDDDDIFAEAPLQPKQDPQAAQALDARMMDNWDDHQGYYVTILGELVDGQYKVTQNLGRGMFSSVVRATDSHNNHVVAIKIIRNNESMRKAGMKEIDILKDIAANDVDDKKHIIRLLRSFDHKGHLCMVFENLSMNLREVLKKFGRDIGINIKAIRAYAQQLFLGLSLLKKCQYLHADLKPDNILVNEARNIVKVCDLGSASPITENATAPYLVSRFYRAPEIILGIPYDYGIDMWSIGCTLFELYTGKILFTGRNNNDMLNAIMACRGKFPHKLLRRGALTYDFFDDLLNFKSEDVDPVTGRIITKLVDVKAKPVRDLRARLIPKGKRLDEQERKEVELFLDLLDRCLDLRPDKRITPTEALKHPFILRNRG